MGGGFYAGFGPILLKQVPYTMAKFAVQGNTAEAIYNSMGTSPSEMSSGQSHRQSVLRCHCRGGRRHYLAPGRHAAVQGEQGGRGRRGHHYGPAREYCEGDGVHEALYGGPHAAVRDDWYPHGGTVRYL